jgi:hypothetical protein
MRTSMSPHMQRKADREELLERIALAVASYRHHDRVELSDVEHARLMLINHPVSRRFDLHADRGPKAPRPAPDIDDLIA